jgi:hypothetical protein
MLNAALVSLVLIYLCTGTLYSQIPESLKSQYHTDKELGIKVFTGRNKGDVKILKENQESAKIVVVQILPKDMDEETAKIVMDWVRGGGTLWYYDSRLAQMFGMEQAPIPTEGLMFKKIDGEYGDVKKHPGIALYAHPFGDHPSLTGVTGAVVFLIDVGNDTYSCVNAVGPTKAILKPNIIKDNAIAAIREEGKGRIIFKPLLWQTQVDGARFQGNLKEFSAGFPIPKITIKQSKISDELLVAKKSTNPPSTVDLVTLSDGRTVWGKVVNDSITFETPDKTMQIPLAQIKMLEIDVSSGIDRATTVKEQKINGFFSVKGGLQFQTPSGVKVTLEKQEFKKVIFNENKEAQGRGRIDSSEDSRRTR